MSQLLVASVLHPPYLLSLTSLPVRASNNCIQGWICSSCFVLTDGYEAHDMSSRTAKMAYRNIGYSRQEAWLDSGDHLSPVHLLITNIISFLPHHEPGTWVPLAYRIYCITDLQIDACLNAFCYSDIYKTPFFWHSCHKYMYLILANQVVFTVVCPNVTSEFYLDTWVFTAVDQIVTVIVTVLIMFIQMYTVSY